MADNVTHRAVTNEKATIIYVLTSDNPTDILMKGLAGPRFEGFVKELRLKAFA
jgi:hypothetical protein